MKISLSNSQAKKWRNCKKAWEFRYRHHITPRMKSRALTYGSLIHDLLDAHYSEEDPYERMTDIASSDRDYLADSEGVRDLYDVVLNNFTEYREYYKQDDFDMVEVERYFRVALPKPYNWCFLEGVIDGIAIEPDGSWWLVEHKSGKNNPSLDQRFWDPQSTIYHYVWRRLFPSRPLRGTCWNYITSAALKPPELLTRGGVSRRKSQKCTWQQYYKAIIASGNDPDDYEDMREVIQDREKDLFKRTALPVNEHAERALLQDLCQIATELREARESPDQVYFTRNPGMQCGWCEYEPLCHLEQITGEWKHAISPDFTVEKNRKNKKLITVRFGEASPRPE